MRCGVTMVAFEFVIALLDGAVVFACGMPHIWVIYRTATLADDYGREYIGFTVSATKSFSSGKFRLYQIPLFWFGNSRITVLHIVLRDFALIFFSRKSTVNFFCSRASPLYFSFCRILSMVNDCYFTLLAGVGMPSIVRIFTSGVWCFIVHKQPIDPLYQFCLLRYYIRQAVCTLAVSK